MKYTQCVPTFHQVIHQNLFQRYSMWLAQSLTRGIILKYIPSKRMISQDVSNIIKCINIFHLTCFGTQTSPEQKKRINN